VPHVTGLHQYWHNWIKKVYLLSDWPAQCPNLNIIENMWAELKHQKHHPISKYDQWQEEQKEWYVIPNDYLTSLYKFLPRQFHKVLLNK